jgi:uncharacterized repeat protein (TIGR01451 family)
VPIKINACWANLGYGVLGHGGAESSHHDFAGAPYANTWFPAALANALSGDDLNDVDGFDDDGDGADADADMEIAYSGNGISWYFGTDGHPSMEQYDFVSVILHEIAHGLGFAGSMQVDAGVGSWGLGTSRPDAYDRFAENGSGQSLLNTGLFPNPSAALGNELRSNNLYFNGPDAKAANGGAKPKLYAPSIWDPGSSYSHLDEMFNGTVNALMTYSLNNGEAVHDPGPVGMGILRDIGWGASPDVSIAKRSVGQQDPAPGDPITFTLTIANIGTVMATHVVVTDIVSSQMLISEVTSSLVITPTGAESYVWDVGMLEVGQSGVITISGQVDPALPDDFALVNTATISDPQDSSPINNTSTVIVGGYKVHLPLVVKAP